MPPSNPFEPGNQLGKLGAGVPRKQSAEKRSYARMLAMSIRDRLHPDHVIDWLMAVWQGKDPLTGEVVPLEVRERALKTLLDRGAGLAAQLIAIEGHISTETAGETPAAARPSMTVAEMQARRAALEALLRPRVLDVEAAVSDD